MFRFFKFAFVFIFFNTVETKFGHNRLETWYANSYQSIDTSLYYGSYYKGPVCTPTAPIEHPKTVDEVVSIVRRAILTNTTVKAFGIRHSATDIICTNGIPIDMTGINDITINQWDHSVRVGSGATVHKVSEFLKQHGRGLKTIPGFGNLTIGGAIGTGAHGTSIKFASSLSEEVIGMTIIDGYGNFRVIDDQTELRGFRIHLGLLGVIVSVTLKTVPLYKLRAHNYIMSDSLLFDGTLVETLQKADHISIYWFPHFEKVVISNWTVVDVNTAGTAYTNDHVPSTYKTLNSVAIPALHAIHILDIVKPKMAFKLLSLFEAYMKATLLTTVPDFPPIYTENRVTVMNPAVGFYYDMYSPICDDKGFAQCPWFHGPFNLTLLDNEFAIDVTRVPAVAKKLKDVLIKYPATFFMQGILLRFSAPTDTYLSNAYGKYTCHFEFYMHQSGNPYQTASAGLAAYQTILQSIVFEHGGKSHWGKSGLVYQSAEILERNLDPMARWSFLVLMNKYDPNGIFLNDFGHRLRGTGTKINIDPETKHCALLDNCICSSSRDCAVGQICKSIEIYPKYPSCVNPFV